MKYKVRIRAISEGSITVEADSRETAESTKSAAVGGTDEQRPPDSRGTDSAESDLRIEESPLPSFAEQISFLGSGYQIPEQNYEQPSFFPQLQLPQQVIDEALCMGFNNRNSRQIICAYFMKDKPLEENAI